MVSNRPTSNSTLGDQLSLMPSGKEAPTAIAMMVDSVGSMVQKAKEDLERVDQRARADFKLVDKKAKQDLELFDQRARADLKLVDQRAKQDLERFDQRARADLKLVDQRAKQDLERFDQRARADHERLKRD